jgi:tetratricopeptide (TPR) repeat protein
MAEFSAKIGAADDGEEHGLSLRSVFKDAIIFAARKSTSNAARLVLTDEVGIRNVLVCEDEAAVQAALTEKPKAALIIDWNIGPSTVVPLLRAAQQDPVVARPVLVIANHVTPDMVAIALEYRVARIAVGQVTSSSLPAHLTQVVKTISAESTLHPILAEPPPVEGAEPKPPRTPEQLIEALEAAHEKYPNNFRITVELAERLIEQEQWVKAEMLLHPLWTLDPPYLRALSAYSRCLMKKKAFADAEFVLQKGKLINPMEPDRLVELGDVLLELGKVSEAKENYAAAATLDPDSKGATLGNAKCQLLEEDINDALMILQQSTSPRELASVFNTAAIISARDNRFEHSLSLYEAATQAVAGETKTLARLKFNQGLAYVKWGKLRDALQCFEEGARLDPQFKKSSHNAAVLKKGLEEGGSVTDDLADSGEESIAEERIGRQLHGGDY